jgi:hypothetical protein
MSPAWDGSVEPLQPRPGSVHGQSLCDAETKNLSNRTTLVRQAHQPQLCNTPVGAAYFPNPSLDLLHALDVGDLLGADLDHDLLQGVELGLLQRDLQRTLGEF